jgi:hypothetical protein
LADGPSYSSEQRDLNTGPLAIGTAVALILVAGPLSLGVIGLVQARRMSATAVPQPAPPWNWTLTINSALLYALAFNLTFFIQELFLVLPKALTPGLRPTLFHNNHTWQGDNPLASLLQGTGALAIFLSGLLCALLLRRRSDPSITVRLFLIWMSYNGIFQSLPQVVVGAINPRNDVGMAMTYLGLTATARTLAGLVALAAMPAAALWLARPLLNLAENPASVASTRARTGFVFRAGTLPALGAILLIIPFRIPREFVEVVVVPAVVTATGVAWLQAGAWRVSGLKPSGGTGCGSIAYPLGALLILLIVFQLILRPGIRFY